jgi:opacity protein-like surface antigen
MKSNHSIIVIAALIVTAASLHAADDNISTNSDQQSEIYRANEFSLDAFGTASEGEYTFEHLASISPNTVKQDTKWGAGAGVNYFATHYLGIGAEGYWQDNSGQPFVNSASGNLMLRLPLGQSGFAPYALGGGGHQFDGGKYWFGQAGAGLEYRFCMNVGMFLDARAVWPDETKTYGVARLGLRFSF